MLNKNGERELAYIVTVDGIRPIDGYDRIEVADVLGWHCVVAKGMRVGDLAVYFEIDSLLPAKDERFAFCEKYKYRVKTQRMCKGAVLSQGLLMPLSAFPELADCKVGEGVTERLGVTYYEPEDNRRKAKPEDKYKKMAARHPELFKKQTFRWLMKREWGKRLLFCLYGKKRDKLGWPEWVRKTDEDRIQNVPWILETDEKWVATEKIDGSSATMTLRRRPFGKRQFIVCSRNVPFYRGNEKCFYDSNVYIEAAEHYGIEDILNKLLDARSSAEWVTIQGEVYGAGIQKRDYSIQTHRFAAFNLIFSDFGRLGTLEMRALLRNTGIPTVPILDVVTLPKTVDEVLALSDGASELDGGMREGIVYRSLDGKRSFKAVSNEYLLKYHG